MAGPQARKIQNLKIAIAAGARGAGDPMTASSEQQAVSSKKTGSKHISRTVSVCSLLIVFLLMGSVVGAQQLAKSPRIGFLGGGDPGAMSGRIEAFRQGLRDYGYIEGKNIFIEYRWSEGQLDRMPGLAAELVDHKVDIVVTHGEAGIRAVKQATQSIPIVVGVTGDLVVTGHAASLARPGGNITGLVDTSPDLSGKRLELLKELLPQISRISVLWNGANPVKVLDFKETETASHAFGLKLQSLEVRTPKDLSKRLQSASNQAGALVVLHDALTVTHGRSIVEFANSNRVPAMYGSTEFVDVGGLMSYAANFPDLFRRAATYVDKILKGAKPADLPIAQPTEFDLVVNLKTAKKIGLTIPPQLLARADRIIK